MRRLTSPPVRAGAAGALALVLAACANNRSAPPGGPDDRTPPKIVKVTPDSGSTNQRPGAIEFLFSKTISDRPAKGELNQYFIISPWDGDARVNWHRSRIDVRPRKSFRANTAYTVTMLPGLTDIRGNAMTDGAFVLFSTGATFPRFGVVGRIFDWAAERPASGAIVQAISLPDSVRYMSASDSLGAFTLGPFGPGRYRVVGIIDRNNNRAIDPGEAWDTVGVFVATTRPVVELLAIPKDTIRPGMTAVAREDSVTIRVTFDRPLDPTDSLTVAKFRVQRADSANLPIASVIGAAAAARAGLLPGARPDTLAPRDTGAARANPPGAPPAAGRGAVPPTVVPLPGRAPAPGTPQRPGAETGPPPPKPSRPAPETQVFIKLAPPAMLTPGTTYRVTARDVRNLLGRLGTSTRTLSIPRPTPMPPPKDTTKPPPVRRPDDSRGR